MSNYDPNEIKIYSCSTVTGPFEFVNEENKKKVFDAYNPNALTERCQALRDRYFALLDRTKNMVGFDKIMAFDEIVSELESMSTEIEYICRM